MIYTSYYANIKNIPSDFVLVSISGGITKDIENAVDIWDKRLAPNLSIFKEYKKSEKTILDEKQYVLRFKNEILENRDLKTIIESYGKDKDIVLLCYEKPEDFCHRQIVSEALDEIGYDVYEYGYKNKHSEYKIKRTNLGDFGII
jgi:uncharacterized protein YeaO (DUF488 family)